MSGAAARLRAVSLITVFALVSAACGDEREQEAGTDAGGSRTHNNTPPGSDRTPTPRRTASADTATIAMPRIVKRATAATPAPATPRPAAAFRPTPDPLGLLASGRGPSLDLAWPEPPREREALWSVLTRLGARAVYADTDPAAPVVIGPSDGGEFRARHYSPLVRLTDLRGLEPVDELERLRATRPHLHTAYVLPRAVDARLLAAIESRLGQRLGELESVVGSIEARNGHASIRINEVDGRRLQPASTVRIR